MDALEQAAMGTAETIIRERGWPWNINRNSEIENATEKTRLMIARAERLFPALKDADER